MVRKLVRSIVNEIQLSCLRNCDDMEDMGILLYIAPLFILYVWYGIRVILTCKRHARCINMQNRQEIWRNWSRHSLL